MRPTLIILSGAGALALGGCAYDGAYYGGSVGAAYIDAAYDPGVCWDYGWNGWNGSSGPAMPGCGWYDGYFYPGSGFYVYDRDHHRHRWTSQQQAYWSQQGHSATPTARVQSPQPNVVRRPAALMRTPRPPMPRARMSFRG